MNGRQTPFYWNDILLPLAESDRTKPRYLPIVS